MNIAQGRLDYGPPVAVIDIGSNSIRQTIADVSLNGVIRVVDEMKAAPRLGAGLRETGLLSEIAIQNALSTLSRMATLASQLGVNRAEVVATGSGGERTIPIDDFLVDTFTTALAPNEILTEVRIPTPTEHWGAHG